MMSATSGARDEMVVHVRHQLTGESTFTLLPLNTLGYSFWKSCTADQLSKQHGKQPMHVT